MRRKLLELKLPYNLTASAAKASQQLLISVKHGKTEALLLNRIKREGGKLNTKETEHFGLLIMCTYLIYMAGCQSCHLCPLLSVSQCV